ncbi:MAG: hypothetical protein MJ059_05175 [Lachnospiraceae bacterium]|nr:hypothetical protein [Lachnospiraceae bacterium]
MKAVIYARYSSDNQRGEESLHAPFLQRVGRKARKGAEEALENAERLTKLSETKA